VRTTPEREMHTTDHASPGKPPSRAIRDRTVAERQQRFRDRRKARERCALVRVGPSLASALVNAGLLNEDDLSNRDALGSACEFVLGTWDGEYTNGRRRSW
jgi:hypothetical protein